MLSVITGAEAESSAALATGDDSKTTAQHCIPRLTDRDIMRLRSTVENNAY
ncbi:MAG: hypothetical protein AAF572_04780 [Cyanobacteria bacterium P01_B01_bin.77]